MKIPCNTYHAAAALLLTLTLLLGGCSGMGDIAVDSGHRITIESDPGGATVLADGAEIGVTPLTFSPSDAFRSGFTSSSSGILGFRYIGKLIVRKPGCKDYVTEVNDSLLAKDIYVKLDCDPDYRPPIAQPTAQPLTQPAAQPAPAAPAAAVPQQQADMPESAEQRLLRIESLHDKGLISDEEYKRLRKRVLETL